MLRRGEGTREKGEGGMSDRRVCSSCGEGFDLPEGYARKRIQCPICGVIVPVEARPAPAARKPAPAAAPAANKAAKRGG